MPMDRNSQEPLNTSSHPESPTPAGTGRSTTIRKSARHASSNPSFKQATTPSISDDQSLTSFPSLSPSLESSPQGFSNHAEPSNPQKEATNGTETHTNPANRKFVAPSPFEGLFDSNGTSGGGRTALFEDGANRMKDVPGNLHCQSNKHVQHLASRVGAVPLIKQLAGDLAKRDAEMTLLQRRAEERERSFRRMLRECGVANLDIENRLRDSEGLAQAQRASRRLNVAADTSAEQTVVEHGTRPESPMEKRMSEALINAVGKQDDLGSDGEIIHRPVDRDMEEGFSTDQDAPSTVRRVSSARKRQPINKTGNWKSYFRSSRPSSTLQGSSRQMSMAQKQLSAIHSAAKPSGPRKGLSTDLFRPPPSEDESYDTEGSQRQPSIPDGGRQKQADTESVKSSSSMASWALKLVAGQTPPDTAMADRRDVQQHPKNVPGKGRDPSLEEDKARQLSRIISGSSGVTDANPKLSPKTAALPLGPNGTVKRGQSGLSQEAIPNALPSNSPEDTWDARANEAGPVEMDTILPGETRPPTLTTYENQDASSEYLTDRFGFIYDQRRRQRQNEAAATLKKQRQGSRVETLENHRRSLNALASDDEYVNIDSTRNRDKSPLDTRLNGVEDDDNSSRQKKDWQDYLKLSKLPTELLSHTPLPAPITSIVSAEAKGQSDTNKGQRGNFDPESLPMPDSKSIHNSAKALSGAAGDASNSSFEVTGAPGAEELSTEPVKSLLSHLTELHDSIQKERTTKWNDFLRKVRAERSRISEGATFHHRSNSQVTPETSIADGEVVGVAGLGNKGKVGRAKWNEFKGLVLGGIPVALRAKIWAECSGASSLKVPGYYRELEEDGNDDPIVVQQIQMDITRTLTDNIFFRKGQGVAKLQEVLLAYARRNPDIGYCQGMNMIAANLLLIMPTAEDAFWMLTSLIENILPEKYYDNSLLTSRADQLVLRQYVGSLLPQLSKHLEALGVELEALSFQWFLSVFTDCLSAEALFRVWDVVLCINDGAVFLFQVALALLKLNEQQLLACESPAEIYGYINQRMTDHAISIDGLIKASDGLKKVVKKEEVEQKRKQVVDEEVEVGRQREAARKQKGKAIEAPDAANVVREDEARPRPSARVEEENPLGELEMRTPMPVDEEASWRA